MKRLFRLMLTSLISLSLVLTPLGFSQAAPVSSDTILGNSPNSWQLSELQAELQNTELRAQLEQLGVDPAQLEERLATLTPEERQLLHDRMDELPAGGILGVLLVLFIVFIITDAIGATDVFTFVNPVR